MLLRCCLIHTTIAILRHVLYLIIFASRSRPKSIYILSFDIFFIFSLIFITINYAKSLKQTRLYFVYFLEHLLFFWMSTCMKMANNAWRWQIIFKQRKLRLRVLLSFWLIFCQFQSGVAYKSVAYKKAGSTVKPVYSEHLRFLKKVYATSRCPLYTGFQVIFTASKFCGFCVFWIILEKLVSVKVITELLIREIR